MGWRLTFEARRRTRMHRHGLWIHAPGLWWSGGSRVWAPESELHRLEYPHSTSCTCRTLRAFVSHLRRHPELRDRHEVRWVSRYSGHDVIAKWEEER